MRGKTIDFCDFFSLNPFMAIKAKKKKKLEADQPTRIHLADSDTNSNDYFSCS